MHRFLIVCALLWAFITPAGCDPDTPSPVEPVTDTTTYTPETTQVSIYVDCRVHIEDSITVVVYGFGYEYHRDVIFIDKDTLWTKEYEDLDSASYSWYGRLEEWVCRGSGPLTIPCDTIVIDTVEQITPKVK